MCCFQHSLIFFWSKIVIDTLGAFDRGVKILQMTLT